MNQCDKTGDFKKYFTENINALGMVGPTRIYASLMFFGGTGHGITKFLQTFRGRGNTIAELGKAIGTTFPEWIAAAKNPEAWAILGAALFCGYVGAIIGSLAVATKRSLTTCETRNFDMFAFMHQNNLWFKDWRTFYFHNPEILDETHPFRNSFGMRLRFSPISFGYAE